MRGRLLLALTLCSVGIGLGASPARAADLVWQVDNPFRFFKSSRSYAMYERAFDAARGNPAHALPADIIWRTERRLNDPDCKDPTTPTTCAATAHRHYELSRHGLGLAHARSRLLRERGRSAPLSGAMPAAIYLGPGEGRLRSARGAHRQRRLVARASQSGGRRRMHLAVAGALRHRAVRGAQAALPEQADHRARAVLAQSRRLRRVGQSAACPTAASSANPMWWSRIC